MLDGHVAVVDVAGLAVGLGVAEVVDDGGDDGVGQAHLVEQGRGGGGEQAAVVGREADGGVAPVDQPEQGVEVVVVAGGCAGEGVVAGDALGHVVANALAEAVVVVAGVVHRQQAAVFGVEDEEQPVEKDEGGFADPGHGLVGGVGEGLDEAGEDAFEDDAGEALGDALFVAAAFVQGGFQKGGGRSGAAYERRATKEQVEGAEAVLVVGC